MCIGSFAAVQSVVGQIHPVRNVSGLDVRLTSERSALGQLRAAIKRSYKTDKNTNKLYFEKYGLCKKYKCTSQPCSQIRLRWC